MNEPHLTNVTEHTPVQLGGAAVKRYRGTCSCGWSQADLVASREVAVSACFLHRMARTALERDCDGIDRTPGAPAKR